MSWTDSPYRLSTLGSARFYRVHIPCHPSRFSAALAEHPPSRHSEFPLKIPHVGPTRAPHRLFNSRRMSACVTSIESKASKRGVAGVQVRWPMTARSPSTMAIFFVYHEWCAGCCERTFFAAPAL